MHPLVFLKDERQTQKSYYSYRFTLPSIANNLDGLILSKKYRNINITQGTTVP